MLGSEVLRMALRSLWDRKARSVLTILGVVIGIAGVIAVTSLGAAFEASITGQFDDVDDRSIFVTVGQSGVQQGPPDAGQFGLVFTETDRAALEATPGVERVIATGQVRVSAIRFDDVDLPFGSLTATSPEADEVRNPGDYLVGGPYESGAPQAVLGHTIAARLSGVTGDMPPTIQPGDTIEVTLADGRTEPVQVAGVLALQESLFGSNNGQVFVPLDPFYETRRTSPSSGAPELVYNGFTVVAAPGADVRDVRDAVEAYMQDRSDAATLLAGIEGLVILVATANDIVDQIGSAFDLVTAFIAGIAGISLLVGGIMIATIMLISVAERTKEIGVMKAIGGLDRDVLGMFLLEAAIIGLLGGLIGIGVGLGAGAALVEGLFSGEDVAFQVPWDWVGYSVLMGVGTGVVAGFLPARRATKVQPVEALSHE